ncbi:hypothetical protein [Methanohalophilus sp. WG1-DM]|uniref:hypothetical protein n=1 Tax=Methanohalophilus sp. WG1-DM TaxID=2491675 RepID=UPI000FFF4085|nr:hypothetical protein [Methanohalophilus sp. WG1-DM]RXG35029.1 hypothetical protein CI957_53 [Methanohalophilus sp. WG1-DM]
MHYYFKINDLYKKYGYMFSKSSHFTSHEEKFVYYISSVFNLGSFQIEELFNLLDSVWEDKQKLFGTNTPYENIILGILYVMMKKYECEEETSEFNTDFFEFTELMYGKKYEKNNISIYSIISIFEDVLNEE